MKKLLTILMFVIFVVNIFSLPISAEQSNDIDMGFEEIFQKGKITEINENIITFEYDRTIDKSGTFFSSHNNETRRKDCCMVILDGTINAEQMVEALASSPFSQSKSYDGAAATLYSTINYDITTIGNCDYIQLISASGYVYRYESRTTVTQNEVTLGTCGLSANGSNVSVTEKYYYPNAYSWSVNAPSKFVPVEMTCMNEWTVVGCKYVCTLKRGTATLQYQLTNNALA